MDFQTEQKLFSFNVSSGNVFMRNGTTYSYNVAAKLFNKIQIL